MIVIKNLKMRSLGKSILNDFKSGEIVLLEQLYEKYVDSTDPDIIIRSKHNIRSVLNLHRSQNRIVNVGKGKWKKI